MKRLPTALMAAAMTSMLATSTFAADEGEWSPNLLLKPNAEAELDDEWGVWKGGFSRLSSYGSIFPHQGNFFFRLAGTVKLTQNINVSDYASFIDNGNAEVKIGSWFILGVGTPECSFIIQYYDENAAYLTEDSESIGCDAAKWTEQQTIKTVPLGTRTITAEIRVIEPTACAGNSFWADSMPEYCDVLLDDAYFHINSSSTAPDETSSDDEDETSNDEEGQGDETSNDEDEQDDETSNDEDEQGGETDDSDDASTTATTTSLDFTEVEALYYNGDLLLIDLVENLQVATRFQRVDLWIAIELPDGNLLFMTEEPFERFSLKPQPFKSSLDTNQNTHRVLEFEVVPSLLRGNYTFYAVYVKEGQNPMNSFLGVRSNIAITRIVLGND
ncbi:hypothetical protein QUF54_05210 [Candidatus Marithioploca araucensis]|uniref:Uncharacterized protein n=1 Tax=Candidatus Marithioploca araucensis TaxID=70273 RepID=A0ABT7VT42_9GAMM|nr:hypothetical protein [Candidatus Marithioploca araucensis]